MKITQTLIRSLLRYDTETGYFTYNRTGKLVKINVQSGYIVLRVSKTESTAAFLIRAHRAAFLYMTGSIPEFVDHKNMDRADNRWENLRAATASQNNYNTKCRSKTGFKGVTKQWNRYVAAGCLNGIRVELGSFDTPEDAHAAYVAFTQPIAGDFFRAN